MHNSKDFQKKLESDSIFSPIITLALPITATSFIQTLYNLVDTYWLGRLGTNELAAINLVTPIQQTIISFGSGITIAGAILLSQNIGANKIKTANKIAGQIFSFSLLFALLSCFIITLFSTNILLWLGTNDALFDYSKTYLILILLGMPFLYSLNIYTAINQSQGESFYPMLINLLGTIINIILDPLLIITFDLGVFGAGIATLLAKGSCSIIAIIIMFKSKKEVKLKNKNLKLEKQILSKIIKLGIPLSIGNSAMQFGFILMSKIVLVYGATAMAAYGIGNKINGLISLPVQGISSALSTVVGQYAGKNNKVKIEKSYILARRICFIFLVIGGVILSRDFVSKAIVSIFTKDPQVIKMGSEFLAILAIFCFTNAIHNTTKAVFNGEGYTKIAVFTDILRIWIFRFASIYILERFFNLGVKSIWYSIVISNGLSALLSLIIYLTKFKNKELQIKI